MISRHEQLYRKLTNTEVKLLWIKLYDIGLITEKAPQKNLLPTKEQIDYFVHTLCSQIHHAEVILCISRETSEEYLKVMEKLLRIPLHLCARGDTTVHTTDLNGNPLPFPISHRRGEPINEAVKYIVGTGGEKRYARKVDRRVITNIQPNPYKPKSRNWERYKHYREGMSIEEYIILGGRRQDIMWDVNHAYITVDIP